MVLEKHRISKLRAAQEQIDVAIAIRADGGSVVAVHTLSAAALELTESLCDLHEVTGAHREMLGIIKEENRKTVLQVMKRPANFFKHGDRDPLEIIVFDETESDFMLYGGILNFQRLGHQLSVQQQAFLAWVRATNPDTLDMPVIDKAGLRQDLEGWTAEIAKLPRPGHLVVLKILIFLVAGNQAAADRLIEKLRRSYPAFSM